jgi:FtsP/CotA-like multicopper oxidase with cupredoxin domain
MGAAFALSAGGLLLRPPRTLAKDVMVELHSCNGVKPMFDVARDCPFSGFELADHKPLSPAPVINAHAEDVLRICVRNEKTHDVGFKIEGLDVEDIIPPGRTLEVVVENPPVGTYLYYDHLGVQRILGAHGVVVVRPRSETAPLVPGAEPVMGEGPTEDVVVGPAPSEKTIDTEYLWVFGAYDSLWGNRYATGKDIDPATYKPDVFTINGRYGDGSSQAKDTSLRHKFGTPVLIRMVNPTPLYKSIHFHAEHPLVLDRTKVQKQTIGARKDVFMVAPMEVVTVHMDFAVPRDGYPVNAPAPGETDFRYPVHDHHELTNSLGGGAYPNGMLTELEFLH